MSAARNWLEAIGLDQYADASEANDIDTDLEQAVVGETPNLAARLRA
jgi:hypothetical protein